MQRPNRPILLGFFVIASLTLLTGCPGPPSPTRLEASPRPFDGQILTWSSPDPALAALITGRAAGWAAQTGATLRPGPPETADIRFIRPAELGQLAADLDVMPPELRAPDHPTQRSTVLEVYRDLLPGWGGATLGLPIAGEGFVLVTNRDRLTEPIVLAAIRAETGQDPVLPATYEDVIELAEIVSRVQNKPALPALPGADADLLTHFHQIAVCYDREAITNRTRTTDGTPTLALHYSATTLASRLQSPGFVKAADYLARCAPLRASADGNPDPVAALDAGAVCAVLSLTEVARLPKQAGAVAPRFAVSPLPGTRTHFSSTGAEQTTAGRGNYVPFVGGNCWVGVVRKSAEPRAAAWDFLADLSGPGNSLGTLADTAVGAGPFRREHLEQARDGVWLAYRFPPAEHAKFTGALRSAAAVNVINPATILRTPDQAARMQALAQALRQVAAQTVPAAAALAAVDAEWSALDAATPPETLARWKRNAAGVP